MDRLSVLEKIVSAQDTYIQELEQRVSRQANASTAPLVNNIRVDEDRDSAAMERRDRAKAADTVNAVRNVYEDAESTVSVLRVELKRLAASMAEQTRVHLEEKSVLQEEVRRGRMEGGPREASWEKERGVLKSQVDRMRTENNELRNVISSVREAAQREMSQRESIAKQRESILMKQREEAVDESRRYRSAVEIKDKELVDVQQDLRGEVVSLRGLLAERNTGGDSEKDGLEKEVQRLRRLLEEKERMMEDEHAAAELEFELRREEVQGSGSVRSGMVSSWRDEAEREAAVHAELSGVREMLEGQLRLRDKEVKDLEKQRSLLEEEKLRDRERHHVAMQELRSSFQKKLSQLKDENSVLRKEWTVLTQDLQEKSKLPGEIDDNNSIVGTGGVVSRQLIIHLLEISEARERSHEEYVSELEERLLRAQEMQMAEIDGQLQEEEQRAQQWGRLHKEMKSTDGTYSTIREDNVRLRAMVADSESKCERSVRELSKIREKLQILTTEHKKEIEALTEQLNSSTLAKKSMKHRLQIALSTGTPSSPSSIVRVDIDEIDRLEKRVIELEKVNQSLSTEYSRRIAERESLEVRKLQSLETEVSSLRTVLIQSEEAYHEQIEHLREQAKISEESSKAAEGRNRELLRSLHAHDEQHSSEVEILSSELQLSKKEVSTLWSELQCERERFGEQMKELRSAYRRRARMPKEERESLLRDLSELQSVASSMDVHIEKATLPLKHQIEAMRNGNFAKESASSETEKMFEDEVQSLTQRVRELEEEIHRMEGSRLDEKNTIERKAEALDDEYSRIKRLCDVSEAVLRQQEETKSSESDEVAESRRRWMAAERSALQSVFSELDLLQGEFQRAVDSIASNNQKSNERLEKELSICRTNEMILVKENTGLKEDNEKLASSWRLTRANFEKEVEELRVQLEKERSVWSSREECLKKERDEVKKAMDKTLLTMEDLRSKGATVGERRIRVLEERLAEREEELTRAREKYQSEILRLKQESEFRREAVAKDISDYQRTIDTLRKEKGHSETQIAGEVSALHSVSEDWRNRVERTREEGRKERAHVESEVGRLKSLVGEMELQRTEERELHESERMELMKRLEESERAVKSQREFVEKDVSHLALAGEERVKALRKENERLRSDNERLRDSMHKQELSTYRELKNLQTSIGQSRGTPTHSSRLSTPKRKSQK